MRYYIVPFRVMLYWIWNIGTAADQFVAACFGFNTDWTVSAAVGWMEYNDYKFGVVLAFIINSVVAAFTFRWQHCRRAYLADQQEYPATIWGEAWKWSRK